jgi:CHAT domain-containing protein
MPKAFVAGLVLMSLALSGAAQEIVNNPVKPPSQNAGREEAVSELMRIEDAGEGFYLKSPSIRVGPGGWIFIRDAGNQVLPSNPKGKFIRGLLKERLSPAGTEVSLAHPFFWAPFVLIGSGD